jgi:hypothetical protein
LTLYTPEFAVYEMAMTSVKPSAKPYATFSAMPCVETSASPAGSSLAKLSRMMSLPFTSARGRLAIVLHDALGLAKTAKDAGTRCD